MVSCFAAAIPSKDLTKSQYWNSNSTILRFLQVSAAPWILLTKRLSLYKWEWDDAHTAYCIPTPGSTTDEVTKGKGWRRVLWLGVVLLPRHLSPLSSPDTKILHSEGFLHLLMSVWSKKHYRKKYLKGREISGQRERRETNLIWMIAQEQIGNKLSLNKCGWKWEKSFQQELWNSLWVRIDMKKNFLHLILTWSRKRRKGRTACWKQPEIGMQLTRVFPPAYVPIFQCSFNYY